MPPRARSSTKDAKPKDVHWIAVKAYVRGFEPLMMHPFTSEEKEGLWTGVNPTKTKGRPYEEECRKRLYRVNGSTASGANSVRIGLPILNVRSCLASAGQEVQLAGMSKVSTAKQTRLYSLARFFHNDGRPFEDDQVEGYPLELDDDPNWDPEEAWKVDVRVTRGNQTLGSPAITAVRPKFTEWGFWMTILVDDRYTAKMRDVINTAGSLQGLGSFRPGKGKGPFGQFSLKHWRVVESPSTLLTPTSK